MDSSVAQALMNTRNALDVELAAAQAKVERLMLERQGVETALRRFGYTSSTSRATLNPAADKEALPSDGRSKQADNAAVTTRVLAMLRAVDAPLRVGEIADSLDLDVTQIRSAIAYLHRKHSVHNPKRGFWQAVIDTEMVSASTEIVSAPTHPSVKGGDARGPGFNFDRVHDGGLSWRADQRAHDHRDRVGG
jgi:hypothetical protein